MRKKIASLALGLAALATLAGGASRADAGIMSFTGDSAASTEGLGQFSGTLDLTGSTLTLVINNLNTTAAGGLITGIAFSGAGSAGASAQTLPTHWTSLTGPVDVSPFDDAEFGVALDAKNPSWLGGGSPNDGIARGDSATFVFSTSNTSDVSDFISGGLYVRFRGFDNEGSDKVPAIVTETPPPVAVPLPAAAWMGLTTLGGIAVRQYRRRQNVDA